MNLTEQQVKNQLFYQQIKNVTKEHYRGIMDQTTAMEMLKGQSQAVGLMSIFVMQALQDAWTDLIAEKMNDGKLENGDDI